MNPFPYEKYRSTPLWHALERAFDDLIDNDDLVITTEKNYVIGYMAKKLSDIIPTSVLTPLESAAIHNALNEVCNGVHMDDCEFQTRLGLTREQLANVLDKIQNKA